MKRQEPAASFVESAGDPARIEKLLQTSVTNGGLWFDDAACVSKFQTPGEIKPEMFPAFAKCLAGLELHRSTREDALGDVVVMTYAPGFEVEARIVNENTGPRLTWIGFVSRQTAEDAPSITAGALESLRISGDRNGPLDPALAKALTPSSTDDAEAQYTWLKVCIDETGAVTSASPFETTSLDATNAFKDAVSKWTFRPFTIQGQPMPVCSMVRPAYPPERAPATETIPLPPPPSRSKRPPVVFAAGVQHRLLEGRRIRGAKNITPDDDTKSEIANAGGGRLVGTFRVCIDDAGTVESVLPLRSTGFAGYDRRLIGGMQQWAYSPYQVDGQPVPVCTSVTFIYVQR